MVVGKMLCSEQDSAALVVPFPSLLLLLNWSAMGLASTEHIKSLLNHVQFTLL